MEWGTPVYWGWFLLFSRSGEHKTKETYPTRPGSPTSCKQGLILALKQSLGATWGDLGRLSTSEIGAAQLRSVTEIAPQSPLLNVNVSHIWYGFRAGAKSYLL